MVCDKCEKKLGAVACPDKWKVSLLKLHTVPCVDKTCFRRSTNVVVVFSGRSEQHTPIRQSESWRKQIIAEKEQQVGVVVHRTRAIVEILGPCFHAAMP